MTNTRPCCGSVSRTLQQLYSGSHRSPQGGRTVAVGAAVQAAPSRVARHRLSDTHAVGKAVPVTRHVVLRLSAGSATCLPLFALWHLGVVRLHGVVPVLFWVLFCGTWTWSAFTALYPPSPCARAVRHLDVVLPLPPHHPPPHSFFHTNPPHTPRAVLKTRIKAQQTQVFFPLDQMDAPARNQVSHHHLV